MPETSRLPGDPPDREGGVEYTKLRRAWRCSTCQNVTESETPIPSPGRCVKCRGIYFEVAIRRPNT